MIPTSGTEALLFGEKPLKSRKTGAVYFAAAHRSGTVATETMTAILCEWDEVTGEEIVELLGRFLPPGEARAEKIENEFLVFWSAKERPHRVFVGRSDRSFDDAYHRLVAKCAKQFLARARARPPFTADLGHCADKDWTASPAPGQRRGRSTIPGG